MNSAFLHFVHHMVDGHSESPADFKHSRERCALFFLELLRNLVDICHDHGKKNNVIPKDNS